MSSAEARGDRRKAGLQASVGASHPSLLVLRQPALTAPVMLGIAVALALVSAQAQVKLLHVLVARKRRGRAVHDYASGFEDVAVIGIAQRDVGVLLREQEAHALFLVQVAHDLENFLDDLRREA